MVVAAGTSDTLAARVAVALQRRCNLDDKPAPDNPT
jgi:hypothetical protein